MYGRRSSDLISICASASEDYKLKRWVETVVVETSTSAAGTTGVSVKVKVKV